MLTCRITSLNDVPDFFAHISLFKRHEIKDIPFSSFLINGDLEWQGDLKQMTPVEFSAVIKFPEEGEWRIYAEGNSLLREEMELSGFVDDILLTVTDEKSYYGWKPLDFRSSSFTGDDIPGINPFSEERPSFFTEAGKLTLLFSNKKDALTTDPSSSPSSLGSGLKEMT